MPGNRIPRVEVGKPQYLDHFLKLDKNGFSFYVHQTLCEPHVILSVEVVGLWIKRLACLALEKE